MAIINRITRLFRADLHAVLDRIEEPDALLRQSVREMTTAIDDDERHLQQLERSQLQLSRQQEQLQTSQQQLAQELEVCFTAEQDELARGLVRRRLETEQRLFVLDRNHDITATSIDDLTQRLRQNRARLAAVEQKLALLPAAAIGSECSTDGRGDGPGGHTTTGNTANFISDDEVEVAFLAAKQQRVLS